MIIQFLIIEITNVTPLFESLIVSSRIDAIHEMMWHIQMGFVDRIRKFIHIKFLQVSWRCTSTRLILFQAVTISSKIIIEGNFF